ncbi:MAG: beta-ketoacyl-ACP synthase II [Actinomycetota bacterium]|nr:MAG: 3-oxoacyl-acyl-carrier-protein synthase [Actinomycetota bacterium]MDP3631356.1 beta-ketoacyl-ACP synthase II [Actinomycetota bacterium]
MRRVVVTGVGAVSALGVGAATNFDALVAGRSGVAPITAFDVSEYSTQFGAYLNDWDPSPWLDSKEARRMARFQQFAVVAADEALKDSGLVIDESNAERVGVIVGSGIGGLGTMEDQHTILLEKGPSRVSPFLVPMMIVDLAAGHISIRSGAKGINYAPVSACATGNHSLGEAAEVIRRGQADAVIAGGFDCGITPLGLAGFAAARALSTRNDDPTAASRPFDAGRDGFVIGEGGGILVLEELESARARGARIYAELVGYGATADAYHMTAPAPDGNGARRAMIQALEQSGLSPADIGYINAHGTSTQLGDAAETGAIKAVFGDNAPPVSSTKSMTGHLLGGAGALEAVVCVLALRDGILPPTINLTVPDAACDLDYVPNVARTASVSAALSNSFGFGGHNACLIFAHVS